MTIENNTKLTTHAKEPQLTRGEWVEVRDEDDYEWEEVIFLTEIEGAEYPFIVTEEDINDEPFSIRYYKQIRKIEIPEDERKAKELLEERGYKVTKE